MLNVVIPMAGAGSRFVEAGYKEPKPFIDVFGKPMIQRVIENVPGSNYILLSSADHLKTRGTTLVKDIVKHRKSVIVPVHKLTEGAACTVLMAKDMINNNDGLIIANSDQLVGVDDVGNAVKLFYERGADAGVLVFFNRAIRWSYVGIDDNGSIKEVAEKRVISDYATCGIYWFRRGRDFVSSAEEMIAKNERVNNEFYVAPAINKMILRGQKVLPYFVNEMYGMGTPEDLERFLGK
ncbi:MAG: glycosyltransferase family 2 protein [Candidatus Omnitrophota bacterium]|jgi:dTDP-glucose pyrophosphorylase